MWRRRDGERVRENPTTLRDFSVYAVFPFLADTQYVA